MNSWARKILDGDRRALARAATAVENRSPEADELLRAVSPNCGRAALAGITGPPGAGKSTLVDGMIRALRREGKTVAVLAVDPSSPFSGGAILGDRVRMLDHHADPGVFIRSMASRGHLGGLASGAVEMSRLFDAAGFDYVLIETVGVGQTEVEVARAAGVTVVVLVPGMGDDVQAMKAGIMEIADVFAINKSDQPGAGQLERELHWSVVPRPDGWTPPVVRTVATMGTGIEDVIAAMRARLSRLNAG
jgi:LAO/AO transport system kinase